MATKAELEAENAKLKRLLSELDLSPSQKVEAGLLPETPSGEIYVTLETVVNVPLDSFPGYWLDVCGSNPRWVLDNYGDQASLLQGAIFDAVSSIDGVLVESVVLKDVGAYPDEF